VELSIAHGEVDPASADDERKGALAVGPSAADLATPPSALVSFETEEPLFRAAYERARFDRGGSARAERCIEGFGARFDLSKEEPDRDALEMFVSGTSLRRPSDRDERNNGGEESKRAGHRARMADRSARRKFPALLASIIRVYAHIAGTEIAGDDETLFAPRAEPHLNFVFGQAHGRGGARLGLVVHRRKPAVENAIVTDPNLGSGRIESNPGTSRSGDDASPVRILSKERCFNEE